MGDAACILLHPAENQVRVIVTAGTGPHFAVELFQLAGIEPFDAACVVAKSPAGFRATYGKPGGNPYGKTAGLMISSDAPGAAPSNFWFKANEPMYQAINRPLWPWDELPAGFVVKARVFAGWGPAVGAEESTQPNKRQRAQDRPLMAAASTWERRTFDVEVAPSENTGVAAETAAAKQATDESCMDEEAKWLSQHQQQMALLIRQQKQAQEERQ